MDDLLSWQTGNKADRGKITGFSSTEAVAISTSQLHSVVKGSIRSETLVMIPLNRENGLIAFVLMMEKKLKFTLMVS